MSNYYSKRDAKVRIAHELMKMGWNVEGYKADESDSMIDYYSPANWDGIATKNGYVLVVDNRYSAESKEIKKYNPAGNLSFEDREKITKLEQMTVERGCTEEEEKNAKRLIEKIKEKISDQPAYEVIGMTTAHMGNPKGSIWHIEKDGKIYDKGNALTKFADVPESWEFDINKMEYTDRYKKVKEWNNNTNEWEWVERKLPDETRKIINDFKALILRFERVVNGMNSCGDGTKETEQKAQEQNEKAGFKKVIVTEYKEEIKVNEIEKPSEIKDGMYFILKTSFNHGCSKGTVYKINSVRENPYNHKFYINANRMNRKLTKVLTGNATAANSFNVELTRLTEWIDKGNIAIVELVTVSTPYEVEKWVKIDKSKKAYNTVKKVEQKKESETATEHQKQSKENILNHKITITADTDTRDNSPLWVVKFVNKVDYDEFKRIEKEVMKPIKGYYSRFKSGFIFKYDPTSILKPEQQEEQTTEEATTEQKETNPYETQEIKDGFIYDCHFKEWDIPMKEIKEAVTALNISFIDWGAKIGFIGITAEQARQVKEISDINGSIFFIDAEMSEDEYNRIGLEMQEKTNNSTTEEVTEQQEEQKQEADNIIDFEEYKNNSEVEEVKTNNNSNDFNFDDIMNQFDNIEINNNSRISADDERFCKEQENNYKEYIEYTNNYIQYLKENSFSNIFLDSDSLIKEMNEKRENNKNWFITKLVNYFKDKYKVTLTSDTIIKKYSIEIDYNMIVTEIIDQLGGYSFTDKAEKELKDEFKQAISHNKIKINNQKISIDNFFYIDSWDVKYKEYSVSYSYDEKFHKLFKAFSHFLFKSNQSNFSKLYEIITREKNEKVFTTHEISNTGITGLKLYKNGKIDIEFSNSEYARQFAKEYCGYIQKAS